MSTPETYMGIDVGTTNCKVGVFGAGGEAICIESLPTAMTVDGEGYRVCDPDRLWDDLRTVIGRLMAAHTPRAIGITGMAEPGVMVDTTTGATLSKTMLWNDTRSEKFSRVFDDEAADRERFIKTGLHNSYKHSIYKLQATAEKAKGAANSKNYVWLQLPSFIAFRLTGRCGTDPTLALRTYAYDLSTDRYDEDFIRRCGFSFNPFPPLFRSGELFGTVSNGIPGVTPGISCDVAVCGHDHICAAGGVCDPKENELLLSLGTTAVLLGAGNQRPLNDDDHRSGFLFGLHVIPGKITWQGALQSAGASIEWIKTILGFDAATGGLKESYLEFDALLDSNGATTPATSGTSTTPGDILYFPYLSGSGAPHPDPNVRGAFMGLHQGHTRAEMARAVIEGIAYELKSVMDIAPTTGGRRTVRRVKAVGGGSKQRLLMQTIANVTNTKLSVPEIHEAALLGAAMLAGNVNVSIKVETEYLPDPRAAAEYEKIYRSRYLPAQKFIREVK